MNNAKAIADYRKRRIQRLRARFDDDDENTNGNGGSAKRGRHGNTKLPFGLCQREGIKVDPNWSPKDAWNALEGKGYSAKESYAELKKTGKAPTKKSGKVKRPPTKIDESHFPPAMTAKAFKKNTMEMVKFVNDRCDDGNITDFLSMATSKNAKHPGTITCHRVTSGEGCSIVTTIDNFTRVPKRAEVNIPMLSTYKSESEKEQAIRSFVHEWTHYIDQCARSKDEFGHFSGEVKELDDAINTFDEGKISTEAKKLFEDFNKKADDLKDKFESTFRQDAKMRAATKMFGSDKDQWPVWVDKETGQVDYWKTHSAEDMKSLHKYRLAIKKSERQLYGDFRKEHRSLMDGVSSLQGIYDALSSGNLRRTDVVRYGHSVKYYSLDKENRVIEALADYVSLKATRPELARVFENNFPGIADAMENTIVSMTKKLRGE